MKSFRCTFKLLPYEFSKPPLMSVCPRPQQYKKEGNVEKITVEKTYELPNFLAVYNCTTKGAFILARSM